jgi:hypothetical protein
MIRTQIQLTEEQYEAVREMSRSNNESMSAIIRRAVERLILTRKPDRSDLYRKAGEVVGKYRSGKKDISLEHDRYLDEAYGE